MLLQLFGKGVVEHILLVIFLTKKTNARFPVARDGWLYDHKLQRVEIKLRIEMRLKSLI